MAGAAALPRHNGELVFEAPWQGRSLGLALAIVQDRGLEWEDFRQRLIAAIGEHPDRPYYESWIAALTALVINLGVTSGEELEERAARMEV